MLYLSVYFHLSRSRSVSVLLAVYFSRVTRPRVGVFSFSFHPAFFFRLLALSLVVRCSRLCVRACMCVRVSRYTCVCGRAHALVFTCAYALFAIGFSRRFEAQLPHAVLYGSIVLSESYTRNRVREKRVLSTIDDDDNWFSLV